MMKAPHLSRQTKLILLAGGVALVAALGVAPKEPTADKFDSHALHEDHDAGAPMTHEAMQRWVREYFEVHPEVGAPEPGLKPPGEGAAEEARPEQDEQLPVAVVSANPTAGRQPPLLSCPTSSFNCGGRPVE